MPDLYVENLKIANKNLQDKLDAMVTVSKRYSGWLTEQANTYIGLGELQEILESDETDSVKVVEALKCLEQLNDPEYLQQSI